VDLTSWQAVITTIKALQFIGLIAFNPSGDQLAFVENHVSSSSLDQAPNFQLNIYDLAAQKLVAQKALDYDPRAMKFSADGSSLAVFGGTDSVPHGSKPPAHIQLLDAASLEAAWEPTVPDLLAGMSLPENPETDYLMDVWEPGAAFSADGSRLYIVHSDGDVLTKVDFERRTWASAPIRPRLSWWERLLSLGAGTAQAKGMNGTTKSAQLSADGKRLYVSGSTYVTAPDSSGNLQFNQTPLGLQVIDLASGAELGKVETNAGGFSLAPDGGSIYLYDWNDTPSTEIVEAASLKVTQRLEKGAVLTAHLLDGEPVTMLQMFSQVSLLDPHTLSPLGKAWYTRMNNTLMSVPFPY
jgi:hypothetical protein